MLFIVAVFTNIDIFGDFFVCTGISPSNWTVPALKTYHFMKSPQFTLIPWVFGQVKIHTSHFWVILPHRLPCFIFDCFCVSGAPTAVLWRWRAWRLWRAFCCPARSSLPTWCSARSSRSTHCRRARTGWANSWLAHLRVKRVQVLMMSRCGSQTGMCSLQQ